MNLSQIPQHILFDCVTETAQSMLTTVDTLLGVLEPAYPGVSNIYHSYTTNIQRLPDELVQQAIEGMSLPEIRALGATSSRMYRLTREPEFWRRKLLKDWGEQYDGADPFEQYGTNECCYISLQQIPDVLAC